MRINEEPETVELTAQTAPHMTASEVVLGRLVGLDNNGRPLVSYALGAFNAEAVPALSTQAVRLQDVGRQLALLFAGGDAQNPVIMGLIHSPLNEVLNAASPTESRVVEEFSGELQANLQTAATPTETRIEGKRLVFEAEDEVVIRCGESAIILTKNGKVTIRGKYLLSRASGVNRILGGSVQVN